MISLSIIVIVTVIIAVQYKVDYGIFIATAIGALAYPIVILRERYLDTPELDILFDNQNYPELYRPALTLIELPSGRHRNTRIEIRVVVNNKGSRTAKSCIGEIELVERSKGCEGFTREPKVLQWTRSTKPIDILPKQKATLDVAFSELGLALPFGGQCSLQNIAQIKAWASTTESIMHPQYRLQDGFCEGEFRVRITVYSENSEPESKEFFITVGSTYQDLKMRCTSD